jgi:DNA-binding LacI/PurR family transcriptional regulator
LFQLAGQEQLPLVLLDRTFPGLTCDYVTSTNYAGAYSAVEYLIRLGHRQIAFLSHSMLQLLPVSERLRGYQSAMQEAKLMPAEPWIIPVEHELGTKRALDAYRDFTSHEVERIAWYLKEFKDVTAIFALNDLIALLTLKAAQLAGLTIPDDLAVIGFDDMDIAAHVEVPLTTITQDAFALGHRAAELLIERIEGYTGPPRQELLATQLKVRASTAPPATIWVAEKSSQLYERR